MPQAKINPWKWQDQYGFSQAIEVSGASRLLFCAGQIALDADGKVKCAGDMRMQSLNDFQPTTSAARRSILPGEVDR